MPRFVCGIGGLGLIVLMMAAPSAVRAQQEPGTLAFTDITSAGGMDAVTTGSHGAMFADVTNDGLPDLYVTYNNVRDVDNPYRRNRFYRNVGGRFVEEADARNIGVYGGGTHGAAWADLDNDGDFDLTLGLTYLTVRDPYYGQSNRIYRNDNGMFVNVTPSAMSTYAAYTRGILAFDPDRDGDLDIFAVNGDQGSDEPVPDRNEFYRNDGGFGFTSITSGVVIEAPAGQSAIDTDYDGDGDIDLLACNRTGDINILRNDNGVFTRVNPWDAGIYSGPMPATPGLYYRAYSGISTGDLDNDGDLDLVFIEQSLAGTEVRVAHIYHNVGNGLFIYRQQFGGFSGLTAGLADLDNDTDLDLVLPGLPVVLLNDGRGIFGVGPAFPGPASGFPTPDVRSAAFADIDLDGDLDFTVTAKYGRPYLVRNDFNAGEWLAVGLIGPQGQAGAFGAKIRVFAAGTRTQLGFRELKSSTGYLAQDDPVMHFGLGTATLVDLEATYLDGTVVTLPNLASRRRLILKGSTVLDVPQAPQGLAATVVGTQVTFTWTAPPSGGVANHYVLQAGSAPGLGNLASLALGNQTGFSITAPAGVYYVRLSATNYVGTSVASNEVVVRVGYACSAPPAAPSTLSAQISGLGVTFSWVGSPSQEPTAAYLLEVGSRPGVTDLAAFQTTGPNLSAAGPPGLYYTRLRARNACGDSSASNEVQVQLGCAAPPDAPSGLSATVNGSTVRLSWSAAAGEAPDRYIVEAGLTPGATDFVIDTLDTATTWSTTAPPGTYTVGIRGRNACGTSGVSNQVAVVVY